MYSHNMYSHGLLGNSVGMLKGMPGYGTGCCMKKVWMYLRKAVLRGNFDGILALRTFGAKHEVIRARKDVVNVVVCYNCKWQG